MSNITLGTTIPTDFARRYLFDGDGMSNPSGNNATVTNGTYVKAGIGYQAQCLSWGATTTLTYSVVTYTNSYIWIKSGGVWTFTKNSSKVTATALLGTNGEYYAMLTFFNRTLTDDEEQILKLEGLRKLGPSAIASYPNLLSGLVGYYDFRGDASNLVDGVAGTVSGATLTTDRFGNANSAYSFNGINNYINLGANKLITIANPYTIYAFVKYNYNSSYQAILGLGDEASKSGGGLFLSSTNGCASFYDTDGVSGIILNSTNILTNGNYYGITCVKNSLSSRSIYINGVINSINSNTISGNVNNTRNTFIGANFSSNLTDYFSSNIDLVMIFNRALSANEVKALYELTSKDYIYPSPSYDLPNLRDGLVLDLNEQGRDLSGNGNNGTLVNNPTVVRQGKAKGLNYNGGHYISTNYNPQFTSASYFSYMCWFKSTDTNNNKGLIGNYWFGIGGNNNSGILVGTNTTPGFYLTAGTNHSTLSSNMACNDGKWHLVVGTFGNSVRRIYIDGILKNNDTYSTTGNFYNTLTKVNIGNILYEEQPGIYAFSGNIANPKIRNRVLSQKEIEQLYYSQKLNYIY